MYSARLRTAPIWSSCVTAISSPSGLNLQAHQALNILLLSATDLSLQNIGNTHQRIHRLAHLTAQISSVAMVFLLAEPPSLDHAAGLSAYTRLQHSLLTLPTLADARCVPCVPLNRVSGLVACLNKYASALGAYTKPGTLQEMPREESSAKARVKRVVEELLPMCSANGKLSEGAVMRVLDVGGDLRQVAHACLTRSDAVVREVGDEGRGVVEFWEEEWVVE